MRDIVVKIMVNVNPEYFMINACRSGNLGIVKYLWKNHRPFGEYKEYFPNSRRVIHITKEYFLPQCITSAAVNGHIDVLKFLDGKKIEIPEDNIYYILIENNDMIVEYIIEKYIVNGYDCATAIVHNGNVKMAEMLLRENPDIFKIPHDCEDDEGIVYEAAETGNLEMVKLVVENGADFHYCGDMCMLGAVKGGNIEILDYLYGLGCSPNGANGTCPEECVESNNLEALKWFHSKGADIWSRGPNNWAPVDGAGLLNAACNGKKKFLKWFKELLGGI
jgi:hypothetical protein